MKILLQIHTKSGNRSLTAIHDFFLLFLFSNLLTIKNEDNPSVELQELHEELSTNAQAHPDFKSFNGLLYQ